MDHPDLPPLPDETPTPNSLPEINLTISGPVQIEHHAGQQAVDSALAQLLNTGVSELTPPEFFPDLINTLIENTQELKSKGEVSYLLSEPKVKQLLEFFNTINQVILDQDPPIIDSQKKEAWRNLLFRGAIQAAIQDFVNLLKSNTQEQLDPKKLSHLENGLTMADYRLGIKLHTQDRDTPEPSTTLTLEFQPVQPKRHPHR